MQKKAQIITPPHRVWPLAWGVCADVLFLSNKLEIISFQNNLQSGLICLKHIVPEDLWFVRMQFCQAKLRCHVSFFLFSFPLTQIWSHLAQNRTALVKARILGLQNAQPKTNVRYHGGDVHLFIQFYFWGKTKVTIKQSNSIPSCKARQREQQGLELLSVLTNRKIRPEQSMKKSCISMLVKYLLSITLIYKFFSSD